MTVSNTAATDVDSGNEREFSVEVIDKYLYSCSYSCSYSHSLVISKRA